jgi:hypothetical protein
MGARLIVQVDPRLDDGHVLALEDASPNPDDIRLRVLDCDDGEGSPVDAEIESETFLGLGEVALMYEGGIKLVDVEEPAMAAANGGGTHAEPTPDMAAPPPTGNGGGGPMFGADGPGAGAPPPAPAAPAPGPAAPAPPATPAPAPGDAAPAAPSIGYGLLDAPDVAVLGKDFVVTVGLSETFKEGVADKALPKPPGVGQEFTLQVQLQTDIEAFAVRQGSSWTVELEVNEDNQHPTQEIRFVALDAAVRKGVALMAFFSIEGQSIGWMARSIGIVEHEGDEAPAAEAPVTGDIALPAGKPPPDLTIHITESPNEGSGALSWVVTVRPDLHVELPNREKLYSNVGDPSTFAQDIIDSIPAATPKQVYETVVGYGETIRDHIPNEVVDTYLEVEKALAADGKVPTVLIHTQEPYIPWELAVIDPEPKRGQSPILGARAAVGRWMLPGGGRGLAFPPPAGVDVRTMAVVSGDYKRAGWGPLPEARKEAEELVTEFKAKPINAAEGPVSDLLSGKPRAQALHFAIHGKFGRDSVERGMILVDGHIAPPAVRGAQKLGTPFIFLNACQLGASDKVLGDYAGLAQAFLMKGASAVIAPLWNVRDTIARQISLEFYRAVYGSAERGEPITAGEALRQVRAKFTGKSQNATYVAYQLYGDPNLKLTR